MNPTARLGAFLLAALVILGVFIVKIEEIPIGAKGNRTRVQAAFPSVAGLDEKSPVRIAGVRVGLVEKIELDGARALVTLVLNAGIGLRQGATAEVTSLGMLGDKYVELYPGPLDAPALLPGTVLVGVSPVPFDQVLKTANDMGSDLREVTASLRKSLGGDAGEQRMDEILENIRQLTADTREMVRSNREDVDATIANFRSFSDTLKTELPRLAEKLNEMADRIDGVVAENRGNLNDSLANIKDLSGRLRTSADNLNDITGKINRGEGTIGKLVNDETTVDNLNTTLKSVESGVQGLKDTIGRAQRWKLDMNVRGEALPSVEENGSRSALGLDLHTTDTRFFRLEFVSAPLGKRRTTTEVVTFTYPDGRTETTTTTTEKTSDAPTFNAQIGYHVGNDFTLRAGMFESTGGVGIDKALLSNKIKLSLEAYDFNRDSNAPHLRLEGRYYLTPHLFAYTGWDDPVWKQQSSVLFGGGVTWGDEDVKYLFGTAAAFGN